jgi:capsular exopolysaccharide synthesis family protein
MDATRTMLVHAVQNEGLRVVVVTSAVKGEGKTLLCTHLAGSMARSGFRTLLIDADFRHPTAHRLFDIPCTPGLSELLHAQVDPEAVLYPGPLPDLTVMPAGQWHTTLGEALTRKQSVATILKDLKKSFDFILIDTAPVLVTPETLMVCQHADGVLFSVLRGVSRLPAVYAAYERMAMLRLRILGAVLGKAAVEGYHYGYERPTTDVL